MFPRESGQTKRACRAIHWFILISGGIALIDKLYESWRARRVLLVGGPDLQTLFTQALLEELGAKPARIPSGTNSETLCRALSAGRIGAVIVPRAHALAEGVDPIAHLSALQTLTTEVREAGVPLLILCSDVSVYRAHPRPWYAREEDLTGGQTREGLCQSLVQLYAEGAARGLIGDAVSTLIVRHMPCLGGSSPLAAQYTAWCRALLHSELIPVEHPAMQGVFLHPLEAACGALMLGARFFSGDAAAEESCVFNLGAGPHNLCANRSAALRFVARQGGTRPIQESEPPLAVSPPLLDGSRARLLCGARCLFSADESLDMLLELERAAQADESALPDVIHEQVRRYASRLA